VGFGVFAITNGKMKAFTPETLRVKAFIRNA